MEEDVTGQARKMGRYGNTDGWRMDSPHPFIGVEIDARYLSITGRDRFKDGSYTIGEGIVYRTLVPGNTESHGAGPGVSPGRKIGPSDGDYLMSI
jgi:hypothetical protein